MYGCPSQSSPSIDGLRVPTTLGNVQEETKREKFERLAGKRAAAVEDAIRKLANLSNPYQYEYDREAADALLGRVEQALRRAEHDFTKGLVTQHNLRERRAEEQPLFAPFRVEEAPSID